MDVSSQGYPFLEVIRSFLSWADELVVVDGARRRMGLDLEIAADAG
jgi:hypothetical protein